MSRLTQLWDALPEKYRDTFDSLLAFSSTVCFCGDHCEGQKKRGVGGMNGLGR